jgi:GGDEF domain-containing protein
MNARLTIAYHIKALAEKYEDRPAIYFKSAFRTFSFSYRDMYQRSLGVANYVVSHPRSAAEFIRCSDMAMYQAKRAGRNCYKSHRPALSSRELAEQVKDRMDPPTDPSPA